MSLRPRILQEYMFREEFKYRGGEMPSHWTSPVGVFSVATEKYLEVEQPGELVYNGTSLDDLRLKYESTNANFAIVLRFFAREDMKFELRGRRADEVSHIALEVDFETKLVSLSDDMTSGGTLASTLHDNLKTDGIRYYSVELWMHEETIMGFINGALVIEATSATNLDEMGFSLWVSEVYLDDPPIFNAIVVHDLYDLPDRQLDEDPSNLFVMFRDQMTDQIDDWAEGGKYSDFVKARKHWHMHRNMRYPNLIWEELGYPFYQPRSEEWYKGD